MKEITIDRGTWRFGGNAKNYDHGEGFTALLNTKGKRCCLGFVCSQIGFSDEALLDALTPSGIDEAAGKEIKGLTEIPPGKFFARNLPWLMEVLEANDDYRLSNKGREEYLSKLFLDAGYFRLRFVGEYPK